MQRFVTFDWALKRLLRKKENFDILEGFLIELFQRNVKILNVIGNDGNREWVDESYNHVDFKVKLDDHEVAVVEFQTSRFLKFLKGVRYGCSKKRPNYLDDCMPYDDVCKVISVNLLLSKLGEGPEYIYHGTTTFRGVNSKEELQENNDSQHLVANRPLSKVFPEHYLVDVYNFDDQVRNNLDQWIYFIKNGKMPDDFDAPGLVKARQVLCKAAMSDAELLSYDHFQANHRKRYGELMGARWEGCYYAKKEIASKLLAELDDEQIAEITELSVEEVASLRG